MPRPPGPYSLLARLVSQGALPAADDPFAGHAPMLQALLGDLARRCAVRYAALWLPTDPAAEAHSPQWSPIAVWRSWGPTVALPDAVEDPEQLLAVADVAAMTDVRCGGMRRGVVVLANRRRREARPLPLGPIGDAVACIALVLSRGRHRADADAAGRRAFAVVAQAAAHRRELAAVRAVERDRLAMAVTASADAQLRMILAHAEQLGEALRTGSADAANVARPMRARLHEMIEQFRIVVRGVYPQVLRVSGVRAAIEELAASLAIPVFVEGDLGRRQGWEIESALFQAAASAVASLGAHPGAEPMRIALSRSGEVLSIRLRRAGSEPTAVRLALREDVRRLAALGGRLGVEATVECESIVDIRLSERLSDPRDEPAEPGPAVGAAGHLLGLLVARRQTTHTAPVRVALDRQDHRARVLLVGARAADLLALLCGRPVQRDGMLPAMDTSVSYQYGRCPRIALYPQGSVSAPVVFPPDSQIAWQDAVAGVARAVVDLPAEGLRGLRVRHSTQQTGREDAARLRRWWGTPDGPPDAVVMVLAAPPTIAEAQFLVALRATDAPGFRPSVICAMREAALAESRQRLETLSDVVVGWHPAEGGGAAVEQLLRLRSGTCGPVLAARWALRAATECRSAGQLDAELAEALETATVGSREVAELDLLQALQTRDVMLPFAQAAAERLLGAEGVGAHARLGLPAGAAADEVSQAAGEALAFWRTQSLAPDSGQRRSAYARLARTCEWLLTHRIRP
jgi:hypothetical protein